MNLISVPVCKGRVFARSLRPLQTSRSKEIFHTCKGSTRATSGTGNNEGTGSPTTHQETLQQVRKKLSQDRNDWDELWKQGLTPWDLGRETPVLTHELEKYGQDLKRSLIPGCGSGYDLITLAKHRRSCKGNGEIVGLDLSESSIWRAESVVASSGLETPKDITLVQGDFFDFPEAQGGFDFIFDYTFFCALPHDLRPQWGKRMGELLNVGGRLLTIVFPIDEKQAFNVEASGPPYPVSINEYEKVLVPEGILIERQLVSDKSIPQRAEREMIVWWARE